MIRTVSRRRTLWLPPLAAVAACLTVAGGAAAEPPQGQIELLAGTTLGFSGDNGPAISAQLSGPVDVSAMPDGGVLIADSGNNRIRKVAPNGTITTVAGAAGICPDPTNPCGDGGPATAANLTSPRGVASTGDGGFLIADSGNERVRRVAPDGTISAAAGTGNPCSPLGPPPQCGDGGAATSAFLSTPQDVAVLPGGGYLIADTGNDVVRMVSAAGIITTVAGSYSPGSASEGAAAVGAPLTDPFSVSPTPDGGFLVADAGNHRIRKVLSNVITTVAGTTSGFSGDNGPATAAQLNLPQGVVSRPDNSFFIADSGNNRVRRVASDGTITSVAGTGTAGSFGDGGPATSAQLNDPRDLAQCGNSVLVSDFGNNRVRWFGVAPINGTAPCVPPAPAPPATTTTTTTTPVTTTTPAPIVPQVPLPGLSPVLGSSIVATPVAGTVLVRRPGERAFSPLASADSLPIGTEFDTTHGTVHIDFAIGPGDQRFTDVSRGRFRTKQRSVTGSPLELDLSAKLKACPRGKHASAARAHAARASTRQVRVRARGPVKSKGRYASATVRGTAWTMKDTCNTTTTFRSGTLIRVTEGVVAVADFVRRRTVKVKAGKRYFASARPRR